MVFRYRWFTASLPKNANLDDTLREQKSVPAGTITPILLPDGESGFRFSWQSEVTITQIGDGGILERSKVPSLSSLEFALERIGTARVLIRLLEPGKSARALMIALEQVFGFGFSCSPIMFDKSQPLSIINGVDEARLLAIKISDAVVAKHIVARFEFASRTTMLESELSPFLRYKGRRDRAVYDLVYKGLRGQLSCSANGLVKIGGDLAPRIFRYVERDVRALARGVSRTG